VKDTITTILIIANKKSVIFNKQSHLSQMALFLSAWKNRGIFIR